MTANKWPELTEGPGLTFLSNDDLLQADYSTHRWAPLRHAAGAQSVAEALGGITLACFIGAALAAVLFFGVSK